MAIRAFRWHRHAGRCILSRLLYGARIALYVAVVAATGATLLGTLLAIIAAYFGGWLDWLVSRASMSGWPFRPWFSR